MAGTAAGGYRTRAPVDDGAGGRCNYAGDSSHVCIETKGVMEREGVPEVECGDGEGEDGEGEEVEGEDGKGEEEAAEWKANGSTTLPRPLLIFVPPAVQCVRLRTSGIPSARRDGGK